MELFSGAISVKMGIIKLHYVWINEINERQLLEFDSFFLGVITQKLFGFFERDYSSTVFLFIYINEKKGKCFFKYHVSIHVSSNIKVGQQKFVECGNTVYFSTYTYQFSQFAGD